MRKWLMAFILLAGTAGVRAQQCDVPAIGAQVFVEPGQTPEDIDELFRLLHDNGMTVARIRMFGAHMYRGGEWDFTLYDRAFRAAEKYGVRLQVSPLEGAPARNRRLYYGRGVAFQAV